MALLLESTGSVIRNLSQPPIVIPGLEATVTLAEGSRLLVVADVLAHWGWSCTLAYDDHYAELLLEVDGSIVAQRRSGFVSAAGQEASLT